MLFGEVKVIWDFFDRFLNKLREILGIVINLGISYFENKVTCQYTLGRSFRLKVLILGLVRYKFNI